MEQGTAGAERVTTLELFFDLVFVFTITQLTAVLYHAPSLRSLAQVVLMLGVIWWMYGGYAWMTNAVSAHTAIRRLLLLGGMGGYFVLALSIPHAFSSSGLAFGLAYLVVVGVHSTLFARASSATVTSAILRLTPFNVASALVVVAGGAVGGTAQYVLWALAFVFEWLTPVVRKPSGFAIGAAHFVERHGLVVLVAIGESVVAIGIDRGRDASSGRGSRDGMTLPPAFVERMRGLLGEDVQRFVASFEQPRSRALRVNPLKTDPDELRRFLGVELRPLPWSELGFELAGDAPPLGAHPAHLAGLFYLHEPSSLVVAEVVRPEPGWRVADVAAAPGGKTTHLASLIGAGGVVVANEVSPSRLRVLHENVDRWGSGNVVTTQLSLRALVAAVEEPFDAVVLDAPCTGEGLFRRDPRLVREWSPAAVAGAARRQALLLTDAARIVRAGGVLVYSTCSFELEENEENVAAFLGRNPGWSLEDAVLFEGAEPGCPVDGFPTELTARLWPHEAPGEGQFVARLRRDDSEADARRRRAPRQDGTAVLRAWREFAPELELPEERLVVRGDSIFLAPEASAGVAAVRPGMPLGTARPGRFEPAHALAASVFAPLVRSRVSWRADDPRLQGYLRGETIASPGEDGWVLVCYERWGLGWARRTGGVLKNFFPRSYRLSSTARL